MVGWSGRAPSVGGEAPGAAMRNVLVRWWGWLVLTTVALALLVASRYFEVVDLDTSALSLAFRGAMLIGHFTTVAVCALLPLLAVILIWPRARLVIPLGIV